jgi:hypothetical protein
MQVEAFPHIEFFVPDVFPAVKVKYLSPDNGLSCLLLALFPFTLLDKGNNHFIPILFTAI